VFHRLVAPDTRICRQCSGMGFYYVQTPGRNTPLEAELRRYDWQHADKVLVQDAVETVLFPQPQEATR